MDLIPGNNSFDQNVEIYGYPTVSLGEDRTVTAKTDTLDAGSGYATYLWQDGSTAQRYLVEYQKQTPSHSYSVIVTDANGCEAVDEVNIEFDLADIGVVGVRSPVSACLMTDQEELRVLLRNIGTTTIFNEQVKIIVSLDGGIPVTGQKTLTQALNPGDTLEFLFGYTFDFSAEGEHSLRAYSTYAKDIDPGNDTLIMSIYHYGIPDPDPGNGNDSLAVTLPHTLDAGSDYASYVWNGIPGTRQFEATEYGWYRLTVTDASGCTGTDSVFLMLSNGTDDLMLPGELKVFPVPAQHMLNVEYFYRGTDDLILELFDIRGRKILIREFRHAAVIRTSIDVSGFERGMFYLKIRSDDRQLIRRIVVQ